MGQSPQLRRTEVAQKIRKEMIKTTKEGDEPRHIPSPERPATGNNATTKQAGDETAKANLNDNGDFDARQRLTPRDASDPVDDTELQLNWILQESNKEERTFRIEEEIKNEKRKQRDKKREEKRKQNDEYDRRKRQEVREGKMKDDKKSRDTYKADMQQYLNFQRVATLKNKSCPQMM